MSDLKPRAQLSYGDVVEVYHTESGQHHHTERGCGLLGHKGGEVQATRIPVDDHGGVQVRLPLCGTCDPVYRVVAEGHTPDDE